MNVRMLARLSVASLFLATAPLMAQTAPTAPHGAGHGIEADPIYKAMEHRAVLAELRVSILTAQISQIQLQEDPTYQKALRDSSTANQKLVETKKKFGYDDTYDWDPATQDLKKKVSPAAAK